MKTFKTFFEQKDKGATFTFGRFNPPTTGHAKLVDRLVKVSGGDYHPMIFTSKSQDPKKNPLSYNQKVSFLTKFFGRKVQVANVDARQVFEIATGLHNQGFTKVRMVVGSDRVKEFEMLLKKYNGVKGRHGYYKFSKIEIVSAGERDPDADDVSGMSASKMRQMASDGDMNGFLQGVPSKNKTLGKQLYLAVRKGMGISEGNLPDYMMEDLIQEGVYDPGVFKAVFLMGGPGSGKSTVVDALNLKILGLKLVNTDVAFERGLKKAGMSLKLTGTVDATRDAIRAKAKETTKKGMEGYIAGRLGLIFDTTGANNTKIKKYKQMLDQLGYEYKMVYVKTSLENAQKRNEMRPRTLPREIVQNDWEAAEKNAKEMKSIFKNDFIEVENNDTFDALKKKANSLYSKMMTWTTRFPENKLATAWRDQELLKKKS